MHFSKNRQECCTHTKHTKRIVSYAGTELRHTGNQLHITQEKSDATFLFCGAVSALQISCSTEGVTIARCCEVTDAHVKKGLACSVFFPTLLEEKKLPALLQLPAAAR